MTQWHGGKGSAQRPQAVDANTYQSNWDRIFGKNKQEDNTGTKTNEYQDILSTEDCIMENDISQRPLNIPPRAIQ